MGFFSFTGEVEKTPALSYNCSIMKGKQDLEKMWDITRLLDEKTPIYEGDPPFAARQWTSLEEQGYVVHQLTCGTHCGTHIDAPAHYIQKGKTVDELNLSQLCGRCYVGCVEQVMEKVIDGADELSRVLLKAGDRTGRLSMLEARKLAQAGIRLVGTEEMTIGDDQVHRFLLQQGVVIAENLALSQVKSGYYRLILLPLLVHLEAAPARAILIEERGNDET